MRDLPARVLGNSKKKGLVVLGPCEVDCRGFRVFENFFPINVPNSNDNNNTSVHFFI